MPDAEPTTEYLGVYKNKLRELSRMLCDVYPPAESNRINQKLTAMGQVPLFVSFGFVALSNVWQTNLIEVN